MSNEIRAGNAPGLTLYACLVSPTGLMYNTATAGFEAFAAANWPAYAIPLAEQGTSGIYLGTVPAGVPAGLLLAPVYLRAGAAPALAADVQLDAAQSIPWVGSAVDTPGTATLLTRVPGTIQPQSGDSFARLGAPIGSSLAADIQTRSTYSGGPVASVIGNVGGVVAPVTVGSNNDKAGYALTQAFPANFASLGITSSGKVGGVALVDTLTTYTGNTPQTGDGFARLGAPTGSSLAADIQTRSTYSGGPVAAVIGNVGGSVASVTAPVTVGTNNDKAGYALAQAFPANFASLGITAAGKVGEVVLVDTLTTYTGNTPQTGDSFARLGANGANLTALAPAATALSTTNWTNIKAGYIDASISGIGAGGFFPHVAPAGWLDTIAIESGLNLRQAIAVIAAVLAGETTGAPAGTSAFQAAGNPGTIRVNASLDGVGNRPAVTLNPPA